MDRSLEADVVLLARGVRTARVLLVVLTAVFTVSVLPGVRPDGTDYVPALDLGLTSVVLALALLCCVARAVLQPREQAAWILMAAAVGLYLAGNAYYYVALADLPAEDVPYPSGADVGWLAWYPFLLAALVLLVRARLSGVRPVLWLDGLTAGAGAAALAGALVLEPLLGASEGTPLLVLTNLAYPVADLAVVTVVTLVFHLNGWRPDRSWWWIAAAGVLLLVGDSVYMLQLAAGTYTDGSLLDASWPAVFACLGLATGSRAPERREVRHARSAVTIPVLFSIAGTAVLFAGATGGGHQPVVVGLLGLTAVLLACTRLLLTLRDTQRLAEARREARTDELTGLPNRRQLMDRLGQALLQNRRSASMSAVLLIDLDRFKEVNDTLGHDHGDQLLRAVAERLQGRFRDYDTVARLGGDEFAVLLPQVADRTSAQELAQRCLTALEEDFLIDGLLLHVEASVGLAMAPQHGDDGNALLRAADVAMYEAKSAKQGVVVYDPDLDVHTPNRLALLGDLRRALQTDEIVLHYQPKMDLQTHEIRGVEALIRWHHPVRGTIPPVDFIPAAEGTGLITPLTLRTLEMAIAQARRWSDAGHSLQIAVNLSPRCLLEMDLPGQVQELLHSHGLPPHLLRLELTESTIMVDPARALTILSALNGLGVSLSIDDFGTGYSSMSYLKRMPVDELKVDRSFVMDMLANSSDSVLVRSSIELGHNLGLSVVAEGVEDGDTLDALSALGCDVVQGFHLGYPMAAPDVITWLDARSTHEAPGVRAATP